MKATHTPDFPQCLFSLVQGGTQGPVSPLARVLSPASARAIFRRGLLGLKGPLAMLAYIGHVFSYLPHVRLLGHKKGASSP